MESLLICEACNLVFNTGLKKPIILQCGDTVCTECYKSKVIKKNLNGTFYCCIDTTHEIELDQNPKENRSIMRKIQNNSYLYIFCDQHKDQYARFLCCQCESLVCKICAQSIHVYHKGSCKSILMPEDFMKYLEQIIPKLENVKNQIHNTLKKFSKQLSNDISMQSQEFMNLVRFAKEVLHFQVPSEDKSQLDLETYINLVKPIQNPQEIRRRQVSQALLQDTTIKYHEFLQLVNQEVNKSENSLLLTHRLDWKTKTFSLIYQGSTDGLNQSKFYKACEGKQNLLIFIHSKTSGQTFGGFLSIAIFHKGCLVDFGQCDLLITNIFTVTACLGRVYKLPPGIQVQTIEAFSHMSTLRSDHNKIEIAEMEVYQVI
eukprot:403374523